MLSNVKSGTATVIAGAAKESRGKRRELDGFRTFVGVLKVALDEFTILLSIELERTEGHLEDGQGQALGRSNGRH
jgi:hypothetical protein